MSRILQCIPLLLLALLSSSQQSDRAGAELAAHEAPPVRLRSGATYQLPAPSHGWPILLCNQTQLLTREARALPAVIIHQHLIEAGSYFRQRNAALELAVVGNRIEPAAPMILDYEDEGLDAAAHQRLARLVHIARSGAPFRTVGMYGYPHLPYRHADSLAVAEMVIEKGGYNGLPAEWGRDALPKYQAELAAAKPKTDVEAPLASAVDIACPSLYVPADYGGDAERVYRACLHLIREAQRWNRPVVAFISPSYGGFPQAEKGLLPPQERQAVLRACRDGGAVPLIWLDNRPTPEMAAAVRQMGLEWRQLAPAGPPGLDGNLPTTRPAAAK